jgi:hypothetical protein
VCPIRWYVETPQGRDLSLLKREGVIAGWHDREISAGQEWDEAIRSHLDSADLILLLVSSDFMASDYLL